MLGLPHTLASGVGAIAQGIGVDHPVADWIAQHTASPGDINSGLYKASGAISGAMGGSAPQPYVPQTGMGRIYQAALGNVVPALVGGGGAAALATREAAGLGGGAASSAYAEARPDDYWGQLAAGLTGALAGGGGAAGMGALGRTIAKPMMPGTFAPAAAAEGLTSAAGTTGADLADAINQNLPQWTPGTQPTLGNVTGNAGIRNLEYSDQAAAARAGDPVYQTNARATSAAQRSAVAGVTPDTTLTLQNLAAARDAAVSNIPAGLSAQDAGLQFRQNLQNVFDQRMAARSAGGSAFDALDNSPAQIGLRPVMDYATEQAAQNAGEVGQAYGRALDQFKSNTGITLDTAPFANSVLKGLGDLAASYPAGSAAARAVNDVKSRAEDLITSQAPEVATARAQWAQNSRPLDVFQTKPFAQVLATDRFGRSYAMPNDAVSAAFLRGNGSADSHDAFTSIFGDPDAATRGLQDFLAGQVRQNALKPDGSIDVGAMQRTLQPYQRALIRYPQLSQQFKTAAGAQQALEQGQAYQTLYNTFAHGLGTMEHDAAGNPMYSAAQFDRAVQAAGPTLQQAYGPQGAAVVNRVNAELSNIAQTAYAKVKGQSGTPQVLLGGGHGTGWLGQLAGSVGGAFLEHAAEGGGVAGAFIGAKIGEAMHQAFSGRGEAFTRAVDGIRRQALTDPAYAKALLVKYPPKSSTPAAIAAMHYVMRRTPLALPAPPQQPQ